MTREGFDFICRILMGTMNINELVATLDTEIRRLTQIRDLLADVTDASSLGVTQRIATHSGISGEPRRRGRPKGSKNKATSFNPEEFATKRRTMSAAGKERIAAAQRARWAKQKGMGPVEKSRPTAARAATKSAPRAATKKTSVSSKKPAAKPLTKFAARTRPVPVGKAVGKAKPAKKLVVKSAVKTPAKKPGVLRNVRAKSQATPASGPKNASAENATAAVAE